MRHKNASWEQSCSCSKCCWYSAAPHWEVWVTAFDLSDANGKKCVPVANSCIYPCCAPCDCAGCIHWLPCWHCCGQKLGLTGQFVHPPGAVLNALHARGCACMQDPLDIGPCAKVLVWAVWAICGTVEKFPLANALRLLPGSAASGEYWEGWSKRRTKGILTSAGRTGPSLWSTRSKDGTGVATAGTESGQRHQSWMAKHLWYFAPC